MEAALVYGQDWLSLAPKHGIAFLHFILAANTKSSLIRVPIHAKIEHGF
jgi:hypothetical protein